MARYNADGQVNLTVVNGLTYVGLNAANGTLNVVTNDGSTYKGRNHPCGAYNAVITTSRASTSHPNGSMYIILQTDGVGYTPVG